MKLVMSYNFHYTMLAVYFYSTVLLSIVVILPIVIVLFSYILAVQKLETEKLSTYECGFEPYEDARYTFGVKFTALPSFIERTTIKVLRIQ